MSKKVLIAGTGLGGLATALRLSSQGYFVEMVEKYHQPGGRLNQIQMQGYTFDMGPSFFSMSYEFDELFDFCNVPNPLHYQKLDPLYVVNFAGNPRPFPVSSNRKKLVEEFEKIEPGFAEKLERYLKDAGNVFHDTEKQVIKSNFSGRVQYLLQLATVPWKHTPKMFRSMWKELENHFDTHEVKVIFSLVAFFLGATPYDTPAVYKLLNYTELEHDGYWNVKGGMYRITEEIVKLLQERGVKITYNTEIIAVKESNGKVTAFCDQNGKEWKADIFISNSDAAAFRGSVLHREKFRPEKLDRMDWTLSPFTMYLGVRGEIPGLHHHNYFLGNNFRSYADSIFKTSVNPEKPYYYVNVSSKSNPDCAPEGCENVFILCPVPDLRYKPQWADREELANSILDDLSERTGFNMHTAMEVKHIMDPLDWQKAFNLYRGSGLGLAHGLNQIGGFRPSNKDEKFSNLYYVGASTTPGTGLPMVVISSKLVMERIGHEHSVI